MLSESLVQIVGVADVKRSVETLEDVEREFHFLASLPVVGLLD
jgi:hypothetical protein